MAGLGARGGAGPPRRAAAPHGRPARVAAAAANVAIPGALDALRAVGSDVAGAPRDFLVDLLAVLGLPGGPLLDGSALVGDDERCRRVLPDGRAVAGFEGAVHEERRWREEVEGPR